MKLNQIKTGAILSYLQMGLNILIGLFYTPVMLELLGESEYGLYNLAASTVSMLSILSLGFNAGYIRYFSKYKANHDEQSIYKLNGLFLLVFSVISVLALACGLFLTRNIELVFEQGLTSEEYETAKVLMLLLTVNLAITFPASVFISIISSHEKFVFLKLLGMLQNVLSPLINLPLMLMGYRSVMMVTVTLVIHIIVDVVYVYYVFKVLKQKFLFNNFEKNLFRSLLVYISFIAINLIVDQINLNIDKVLLGRFKGTGAVAAYSLGYTLYNYYMMLSTSISGVFTPRIHNLVQGNANDIQRQRKSLTELFIRVGRIQYMVLALIASGFAFLGKAFIVYYWTDEVYAESYVVALILMVSSTIPLIQNLGIEIQRAQNKHKFRSVAYIFMSLANLVMSIFLCQLYGPTGSTIGTAISFVLANGIMMNIYYHKKCNVDVVYFWKSILKLSVGLLIPICVGTLIVLFVDLSKLTLFLASGVIYVLAYCASMWFFGMNSQEKNDIRKLLFRGKN